MIINDNVFYFGSAFQLSAQAAKDTAPGNTDAEDLDSDDDDGEYDDDDNDNEIEVNAGNELRDNDKVIAEEIDGLNDRIIDRKLIWITILNYPNRIDHNFQY